MDAELLLDVMLNTTNEAIVVVDAEGRVVALSKSYLEFLEIEEGDAIGRHVTEVIENTRMHLILQTGKEELASPQKIKGETMLATRIPIWKDGRIIGGFGRVLFKNLKELYTLFDQVKRMESELHLYKRRYGKIDEAKYNLDDIIGDSKPIRELKYAIRRISAGNSSVLIMGESGTGKELVAHAIHKNSSRSNGPLICVNSASIPSNLMESELFGYESGSFTGARKGGKTGLFQAANKGTLFLDEIGDLELTLQGKLLRAIQDQEIRRVGGLEAEAVDVRIIAATNRNLNELMTSKDFREDLFYRLNVINIYVPPLRERKEDIPALTKHFLRKISRKNGRLTIGIDSAAMESLMHYDWPGNVRELENALERAFNFVDEDGVITIRDLSPHLTGITSSYHRPLQEVMDETERTALIRALLHQRGIKSAAARELGISRTSLYEKLNRYGIGTDEVEAAIIGTST